MQLGPYVLLASIGAGGMGEVWKARDSRLGRVVAIKKLKKPHSERFKQEARAIAALNHPHICQVYDVGPDYIVLEYVEGRPLPCPLEVEEAVRLAIDIAHAIEAAHRKGIIHRDLKPGNIMITEERSVKLLDFGIAKLLLQDDPDQTRTMEGTVVGTAAYMAPEQAQGKTVDERSDVFSFGAVLYEMLAGRRAFRGGSVGQMITALLCDDPPPLDAPAEVARIVMRCLAKQPAERFQKMADVRTALEQVSTKPAESQPSIAVLPFSIFSADKDDEYFSDGLAEEIINALAQIPGLNVTARTSSFAFRGKEQDIRRIAATLGVRTILEGSLRRAGSRIRVTAQLINAANGYHLWSERYDREMADVFAIQDEIAQAIAVALKVRLSAQPAARREHTPTLPAYEAFLKARHFMFGTPETLARSKEFFELSIALDPEFALALAQLGMCLILTAAHGLLPARVALPQASAAARKALSIDDSLPDAQAVLAAVAIFLDYDWEEAGRQLQLAMARGPVSARLRYYYGTFYLLPLGRIREATQELDLALKEDPLNVLWRSMLALCFWMAGKFQEASAQFRQVLEFNENCFIALILQSILLASQGRLEESLVFARKAHSVVPRNGLGIGTLAGVLRLTGGSSEPEELLQKLGNGEAYGAPLGFFHYHLLLSEPDRVVEWAEKAIEQRDPNIVLACTAFRKQLILSGRWPDVARMLNLPETATGQPALAHRVNL
jgi:serine/threonine-protein kinase